jgi:hypothetical protein
MLTWKSRAISRIVNRREFASGKSALRISESAYPFGAGWCNLLPASCWGSVSTANPD